MGGSTVGYQRPPIRLLDQRLTLDPATQRMMLEIEAQMRARQIIQEWLNPNFQLLLPQWSELLGPAPNPVFSIPPLPASGPGYTPGVGPATPRPGEVSDVLGAVYKLPVVQRLVQQAHDEAMRQLGVLRGEWTNAGTGDRIAMVTMTGIVAGSMVTIILANRPTRDLAFSLIKDKDIPIPGVDGLSFRIMDRGAGATVPLGVPGLRASGHLNLPSGQAPDYGATITFDVMEFMRSRRR